MYAVGSFQCFTLTNGKLHALVLYTSLSLSVSLSLFSHTSRVLNRLYNGTFLINCYLDHVYGLQKCAIENNVRKNVHRELRQIAVMQMCTKIRFCCQIIATLFFNMRVQSGGN